jgi:hypothetical protein
MREAVESPKLITSTQIPVEQPHHRYTSLLSRRDVTTAAHILAQSSHAAFRLVLHEEKRMGRADN